MIQEIPYKYDPAYKKDKKPEMSDYLLHYEYNKVMLLKEKEDTASRHSRIFCLRKISGKKGIICFPSGIEDIT